MAASMAQRLDNGVFGAAGRALFNTTGRAAASAQSGGLADIGNLFQARQVSGGDIRADFLRHADALGVSREQAEAYFRNNSSQVVQSMAGNLQAIMTPQEQANLFEQAERSAGRGTGRGGTAAVRIIDENRDAPNQHTTEYQPTTGSILLRANDLINGDRQADYGDARENLQRIADLWGTVLGIEVTIEQVCLCMIQLKAARLVKSPKHEDSWIDIAGYVGLIDKARR